MSKGNEGKFELVSGSHLILKKGDKVLMSRRCNTNYEDGKYHFPAGHCEPFEKFIDAAIREAKEEVGIIVKKEDLKLAHIVHKCNNPKEKASRMEIFFMTEKWQGDITNMEPDKCDDLKWVDINKLPKNMIPYIKIVMENIKKGIIFSEI